MTKSPGDTSNPAISRDDGSASRSAVISGVSKNYLLLTKVLWDLWD